MNWKILIVALTLAVEPILANPFFAMDTAVRDLNELGTIKSLGYDGIGWKTGPPEELAAAVAQVRQRGLKLFAVYSYQSAVLTATSLVLDDRLEPAMKALEGTDAVIWLPINSDVFKASSPDGDAIAVPALQKLADTAATHSLRVAIYPHKGCWTERVQDAVRVAKAVNRKNFGVTFNLCHCLMVGDETKIPELLAEAKPYLFLVTLNGADSGKPNSDWDQLIRPLDEGSYDTGRLLRTLEELHYIGPIGLQGYGVKLPAKDNLTRSMAAWHRLNPSAGTKGGGNSPARAPARSQAQRPQGRQEGANPRRMAPDGHQCPEVHADRGETRGDLQPAMAHRNGVPCMEAGGQHGQGSQPHQQPPTSEGIGVGGHDRHGHRPEDRPDAGPVQPRIEI